MSVEKKINDENYGLIEKFLLTGRKKVIIKCLPDEFYNNPKEIIIKNLNSIKNQHYNNVAVIKYLKRYKKGLQDILNKIKINNNEINNICITNYAKEIVDFKKGFYVGKPISYVISNPSNDEDKNQEIITYNNYIKCLSKKSIDLEKYDNILTTGIGYTFIYPRKGKYDLEEEPPFEYKVLDNEEVCMVYSFDSFRTPLFSIVFGKELVIDGDNKRYIPKYTCYYNNKSLSLTCIDGTWNGDEVNEPMNQPITEYELNPDRMGVFEPVISSLNTLNFILSNQLDDIQEFVNALLVIFNQDPKYIENNKDKIRKSRIIALRSNNPNAPADIKSIANTLDHNSMTNVYTSQKRDLFNIVGVPEGTSSTGQGVSASSQQYGSGWENAQAIATVDTTYMEQFERQDLKKFINICKEIKGSGIKKIKSFDIEIKYTINKSNDIMTKAQSFKYLADLGVPYSKALEITALTDDTQSVGDISTKNYYERMRKIKDIEVEKEVEIAKAKQQSSENENI